MKPILKKLFSKQTSLYIAIGLVFIGFVTIAIFLINLPPEKWNGDFFDVISSGQIGDFIGGFVGSIWALAGVILLFYNLSLQREQAKNQQEINSQATFFKFLDYHKELIKSITHNEKS